MFTTPTHSQREEYVYQGVKSWGHLLIQLTTPWTEEPGGLQSKGSQRVGCDLARMLYALTCLLMSSALPYRQKLGATCGHLHRNKLKLYKTTNSVSQLHQPCFTRSVIECGQRLPYGSGKCKQRIEQCSRIHLYYHRRFYQQLRC